VTDINDIMRIEPKEEATDTAEPIYDHNINQP